MAQYTHKTPPNQNPPYLSVYDIVYRYRTIHRCNSIRHRIQYQLRYRVRCLIFHYGQGGLLPALDRELQMSTQSIQFLTASGVRSQRKLQRIQDPSTGLGAGCSKSTCGCGVMEGRFLVKSLWIKLWNSVRRGCRNPGLVALRLFGAGVKPPVQRELPLRSE